MDGARRTAARKGEGTVRLIPAAAVCCAALIGACASPGMPPGGPPDAEPPQVTRVTPESGAVNVRASDIVFRFDEVVSETPGRGATVGMGGGMQGGGSQGGQPGSGLASLVMLSPSDGGERVTWRRTAIEITPRGGFRPNTTYRVTLLPGLADLRGNVLAEPREIVFSTGAAIPEGLVSGAVFDWVEGRHAPRAPVEVFRPADSTFRWRARTDSLGRYTVRDLAPGIYHLRAWLDGNNDRRLGLREPFDSLTFQIGADSERRTADIYAFVQDTIGPGLASAAPIDSTALSLRFDRAVALDWTPDASAFRLLRADSSVVALGAVLTRTAFDSVTAMERAAADSAEQAADTAAPPAPPRAAPADTVPILADTIDAAADTASLAAKPSRPIPVRDWVIRLPDALEPGSYMLHAVDVRGLTGALRTSQRELRVRAPAPRDTTATPADTTGAPTGRAATPPRIPPRAPRDG